jgi:hypothetical protein
MEKFGAAVTGMAAGKPRRAVRTSVWRLIGCGLIEAAPPSSREEALYQVACSIR